MPWLLEIAIILSYFLGHYLEAVIIFILLTVNVIITIAAFVLLGVYGIIIPSISLEQVLFMLGFSAFFIFVVVDPIKYWAFKKFCL